jgi:hypothetical protein
LQYNWDYIVPWHKKLESFFLNLFDSPNRYETSLPSKTGRVNAIPTWPIVPKAYAGRVIGTNKGDLVLSGGFGRPSAGMLKISEGTKSFGALG